eukprot:PITA_09312
MRLQGRRPWSREEDRLLVKHIQAHGEGKWSHVSRITGLKRSAKSCRFRWTNYLRPERKFSVFSCDEDDLIVRMHTIVGNRWALIAGRLPGRTALAVKNYWNTTLKKKNHSHVVKPHCITLADRCSSSHHNEKMKGLSSDSFLKIEGQPHDSHDGPHTPHGIAEAETKLTVNAEMNSRLPPVDMEASEQKCMILPDPGSLPAIINNIILQEEDNFSKEYNFLSDEELICIAAGMPYIKEDEIHLSLWDINAEEAFSLWQSSPFHI